MGQLLEQLSATDERVWDILILLIVLLIGLIILDEVFIKLPKRRKYKEIVMMYNDTTEMTYSRVKKMITQYSGNETFDTKHNYRGVYVLYNHTKKKYFVGLDDSVLDAVVWQLSGQGYGSVKSDVSRKDEWLIRTIPVDDGTLRRMGCRNYKELWLLCVASFKSDRRRQGYNRVSV